MKTSFNTDTIYESVTEEAVLDSGVVKFAFLELIPFIILIESDIQSWLYKPPSSFLNISSDFITPA